MEEKKRNRKKVVPIVVVAFVCLLVGAVGGGVTSYYTYAIAPSGSLWSDNCKTKSEQLKDLQKEHNAYVDKMDKYSNLAESEIATREKEADAEAKAAEKKAEKEAEIDSLNNDIALLNDQIKSKQDELDSLTSEIKKKKGEPIKLLSGQYTVGTDLPEGRYRVSGTSTFSVWTSAGDLYISTILNPDYGDGDYVASLNSGMKMECGSPTTFTPVE